MTPHPRRDRPHDPVRTVRFLTAQPLRAAGLRAALARTPDLRLVVDDPSAPAERVDLLLVDLEAPGAEAPADDDLPSEGHADVPVVRLGACAAPGTLPHTAPVEAVVKALREAAGIAPTNGFADDARARIAPLTRREREILALIGLGLTRGEIAARLHRSPKTIDNHRAAMMQKLDLHDRVGLARLAIRAGLSEA